MTTKELLEMVNDFRSWSGNTYTLAVMVANRQREDDAIIAESFEQQSVAEAIRLAQ